MKKIQNEEKKHEDFRQDYRVDKRGGLKDNLRKGNHR